MTALSTAQKALLQRVKDDGIEYICLDICDSYCRSLGKMVHASHFKNYLMNGFDCPPLHTVGINFLGVTIDEKVTTGNAKFVLDIETYRKLPPSLCIKPYKGTKPVKMARIMMHPLKPFDTLDPRTICKNTLKNLKNEFGYNFYSAFEHEFQIFKSDGIDNELVPCWNDIFFLHNSELLSNGYGAFVVQCERTLRAMNIELESMHFEGARGGLELTMKPSFGIQGGDHSFLYKQTVKQIARNHQLRALFATTPECDNTAGSNGAHFNHSVWDENGKNIFFEADSNGCNRLSLRGKYWIGGILEHFKGMTAFCVPTVNCYRRVNGKHNWSPNNASYGFKNRLCALRIKMDDNNINDCYFEYRLPCAASNPYYVISCVVIAGMHGMRNKILPKYKPCKQSDSDPDQDEKYEKVPASLESALIELENDTVICKAFGDWFISLYCKVKRMEIDFVQQYTKQFGDRNKAEKFLFSKL